MSGNVIYVRLVSPEIIHAATHQGPVPFDSYILGSLDQHLSLSRLKQLTVADCANFQPPSVLPSGSVHFLAWSKNTAVLGSGFLNEVDLSIPCPRDIQQMVSEAEAQYTVNNIRLVQIEI